MTAVFPVSGRICVASIATAPAATGDRLGLFLGDFPQVGLLVRLALGQKPGRVPRLSSDTFASA